MRTTDIHFALEHLRRGKVLIYPTETFYGIGVLALNSTALDLLSKLKNRNTHDKPFPLSIGELSQLDQIVSSVPPLAQKLIEHYWPAPLTLVLPARQGLDPRIVGENSGVAVRLSSHPILQQLASQSGQPLISTSANPPGSPPPQEADEAARYFSKKEEILILDGGKTQGGQPSTIIDFCDSSPRLLRDGAIPFDELKPLLHLT